MLSKAEGSDPLYLQIADRLKREIMGGTFPVGSLLPTENELCRRFAVSRYTVRCALEQLRDDGLIASRRGAGTVVIPPPSIGARSFGSMSIEDLLHFAHGSYSVIQKVGMVRIDRALAERLGATAGEEWLSIEARGMFPGSEVPLGWSHYYIRREFAGVSRLLEGHTGPVFPLIERMFGVQIAEVRQDISAVLLTQALARHLLVEPGSPALEVRNSLSLANGKLAQLTISTHPAGRYLHSITMRRSKQPRRT